MYKSNSSLRVYFKYSPSILQVSLKYPASTHVVNLYTSLFIIVS